MSFPIGPNEAERLKTLLETGALEATADPVLDRICEEARQYFDVPICTLSGLRPSTYCPAIRSEWLPTTEPARFCSWHHDGTID